MDSLSINGAFKFQEERERGLAGYRTFGLGAGCGFWGMGDTVSLIRKFKIFLRIHRYKGSRKVAGK